MKRIRVAMALLLIALGVATISGKAARPAAASGTWNSAKSYSAMLTDAGGDLLEATRDALGKAEQAMKAAAGAAGAAGAARAAALAAQLAARAAALADEAAAVAAAAAAGTLVGQGVDWLISKCFDPVCDVTPPTAYTATARAIAGTAPTAEIEIPQKTLGPYHRATEAEVDAVVLHLASTISGRPFTKAQFLNAGPAGAAGWDFMAQGVKLFLGAARDASAFSRQQFDNVLEGVADLEGQLHAYPVSIDHFADAAAGLSLRPTDGELDELQASFDQDLAAQRALFDPAKPGYETLVEQADRAQHAIADAQSLLRPLPQHMVDGPDIPHKTSADFDHFLDGCGTGDPACLPPNEVTMASFLLQQAQVRFAGELTTGRDIASWVADGDRLRELALFATVSRTSIRRAAAGAPPPGVNLAELLRRSVAEAVTTKGPWLGIDLEDSPLTVAARAGLAPSTASANVQAHTETPPGATRRSGALPFTGGASTMPLLALTVVLITAGLIAVGIARRRGEARP